VQKKIQIYLKTIQGSVFTRNHVKSRYHNLESQKLFITRFNEFDHLFIFSPDSQLQYRFLAWYLVETHPSALFADGPHGSGVIKNADILVKVKKKTSHKTGITPWKEFYTITDVRTYERSYVNLFF
jgi:hypothetical protein